MATSLQDLLDTGMRLLRAGQLAEARKLGEILLIRYPGDPLAHLYAADAADAAGDPNAGIVCLDAMGPAGEQSAPVLLRKAELLLAVRRRSDARAAALTAADRLEADVWQYRTLAKILSDCQEPEGARAWLLRGQRLFPRDASLLSDLAMAEFHLNRVDDAEEHLRALLLVDPYHPGALHLRSALRTQTPDRNHIADLEYRLSRESRRVNFVIACCFALAKEYEDLGQYDKSFAALNRGASTYRRTLKYDSRVELSAHEAIRKGFTREALQSLRAGYETERPIFIVGMPRTGTTLVERILTSHSQVCSIGEFTDFPLLLSQMIAESRSRMPSDGSDIDVSLQLDFRELGRRYVEAGGQLAGNSPYFVDKLPYNFLYCGYIHAALPKARIIHLIRNPLDTCYAVYKTLFFNAYSYSYDLSELADYYVDYRLHMEHWHDVFPGAILDVVYEDLVKSPEAHSRRILDWCGLPWEESVLTFHEQDRPSMTASAMQVRRPMYTHSIGAWRRAEAGFGQVHDRLRRAGLLPAVQTSGDASGS